MNLIKLLLVCGMISYGFQASDQSVYITKTGEKYHKSGCHFLKNSKKEITLNKAFQLGFSACSVCKPNSNTITKSATSVISLYNKTSTTAQKVASTQCKGKTKSGTRCKRMTREPYGHCYQH